VIFFLALLCLLLGHALYDLIAWGVRSWWRWYNQPAYGDDYNRELARSEAVATRASPPWSPEVEDAYQKALEERFGESARLLSEESEHPS